MSDRMPQTLPLVTHRPFTHAVRRALSRLRDEASASDLLFLEQWELDPRPGIAAVLRVGQLRRANPGLAAEIRAEIAARGSNRQVT
jgi:hypothetical protein